MIAEVSGMRNYLFLLFTIFTFPLFAQEKCKSISEVFVSSKNDSLPYQLLLPPTVDTAKSYPLILWLHGKGERGEDNEKQMTLIKKWLPDSLAKEEYHSYLLSPQCSADRMWSNYDKLAESIGFDSITPEIQLSMIELINKVKIERKIDDNRIYIMGISMGGFGVFDMITRYPNYFAAAIPICGGADPHQSNRYVQTNIWAFHGEKDNIVPIRHTEIPMKKIEDRSHIFTTYPTKGHDAWNKAFKEERLLKWLFNQSN